MTKSLNEIGLKHGTDKSTITHCYLDNYAKYFEKYRGQAITLLEIGVSGGASIKMWKEYFLKARIFGIDINPDCEGEGIFIGSQTDLQFLDRVIYNIGIPDIIVDDGSHVGGDMIKTFEFLFPQMRTEGVYVLEDTHCFYSEHYDQGANAFGYFSELARHVDIAGRAMTGNAEYAINHGMEYPPVPKFSRELKAIHIHPSLWLLERR